MPSGYLLCDGSEINRITYSKLFNIIGTIYGEGNNETTFNLPNLIDKFIQGGNITGIIKASGLPNIKGEYNGSVAWSTSANGALSKSQIRTLEKGGGASMQVDKITFDASLSNPIYGNSTTVQPPALTMKYLIKYN